MSVTERVRLEAFGRVKRGELTVVQAAELAALSVRQARRAWKRFRELGDAGLVHRLRGQPSNRRLPDDVRDRVLKLHQERYADFGPTLACEKLAEEGLVLSPDTLTALLKERGLWRRKRRRGRHRKRRERRACLGSLVQMDGSPRDWFEGRSGKCVLMVMIDDATSRTYARFYAAETTEAAFDVFARWVGRQGVPRALYVDRHSIYRDEDHPDRPTQFGRAMKELSVELIQAHSPQAKGRVERRNAALNLPRRRVLIKHLPDGQLIVEHKGERLSFQELAAKPVPAKRKKAAVNNRRWKPGHEHPWKTGLARRANPPASLAPATPARGLPAERKRKAG